MTSILKTWTILQSIQMVLFLFLIRPTTILPLPSSGYDLYLTDRALPDCYGRGYFRISVEVNCKSKDYKVLHSEVV